MRALLTVTALGMAGAAGLALPALGSGPLAALRAEAERGVGLDAQLEQRRARNGAKRAVVDDLVAGRLTLDEAARRYERIEGRPGAPTQTSRLGVLLSAEAALRKAGAQKRAEVMARLERERARLPAGE